MLPAAKAGIALVVLASTSVGGYYLFNSNTKEVKQTFVLASKVKTDLDRSYTTEKFGNVYSIYMVDPNNEKNKWWWEAVYEAFKSDVSGSSEKSKFSTEFQNVSAIDQAYSKSSNDTKALNQVCEVAFQKTKTDVSSTTKPNYEDNVWTYCSILRSHPKVIPDSVDAAYTGKNGETHKGKAVSVSAEDDEANKSFWDLRNKEFFDIVSSKSSGNSSKGSIFKSLYGKKSDVRGDEDTVKKACEGAYGKVSSENTEASQEDIKRFCYLVPEITADS
ncbi:hypothetical protein [Candidatus Mycoplasma haematohominis]|uniref:Uncharacterized protein n=1 Tax=Candidatus Mycoplasma haematohominis TaxID=1494318 RepID=A0A478FQ20_9MOLU|nr:hypothetical protein [Candidatus Mycoplasma haemohominis]GCE63523.1 hypothetical protein MHSWG343_05200 [Candidatus Mycoplasma haemohominis]